MRKPQVHITSAIYQEIIPREIIAPLQDGIPNQQTAWYILSDGRLDIPLLLCAFQQFFRENAEIWLQGLPFKMVADVLTESMRWGVSTPIWCWNGR